MNKHTTLEQIKNIVTDIKADDEWVNDSHTKAEHNGVCRGLDMLVKHLEQTDERLDYSALPSNLINIWDFVTFADEEEKEDNGDYAVVDMDSMADYIEDEIHKDPENENTTVEFEGLIGD